MCGIAGFIQSNKSGIDGQEILYRMACAMAHRGPDGTGIYMSPNGTAGLAHRRLAIIDLSPDANQPMSDASGRYWNVYNGEIYNFVALREDLAKKGYPFRTHSDTEVLLALYIALGPEMLE